MKALEDLKAIEKRMAEAAAKAMAPLQEELEAARAQAARDAARVAELVELQKQTEEQLMQKEEYAETMKKCLTAVQDDEEAEIQRLYLRQEQDMQEYSQLLIMVMQDQHAKAEEIGLKPSSVEEKITALRDLLPKRMTRQTVSGGGAKGGAGGTKEGAGGRVGGRGEGGESKRQRKN